MELPDNSQPEGVQDWMISVDAGKLYPSLPTTSFFNPIKNAHLAREQWNTKWAMHKAFLFQAENCWQL